MSAFGSPGALLIRTLMSVFHLSGPEAKEDFEADRMVSIKGIEG